MVTPPIPQMSKIPAVFLFPDRFHEIPEIHETFITNNHIADDIIGGADDSVRLKFFKVFPLPSRYMLLSRRFSVSLRM